MVGFCGIYKNISCAFLFPPLFLFTEKKKRQNNIQSSPSTTASQRFFMSQAVK